jgi:hypothetical protein
VSTNHLVAIYLDKNESNKFDLGWVLDISSQYYVLLSIEPDCSFDHITFGKIDEIIRITYGNSYIKEFEKKVTFESYLQYFDIKSVPADLDITLEMARRNSLGIQFVDMNWEISEGIPINWDERFIEISNLDGSGDEKGFEIIRKDNLLRMQLYGKG